jgi:hypothetical protein
MFAITELKDSKINKLLQELKDDINLEFEEKMH